MAELGKLLVVFGLILLVVGVVFLLVGRTNFPLGRLPGDIVYRGKNTTFYFPLATSILLSVVLSLVLWGDWADEAVGFGVQHADGALRILIFSIWHTLISES